MLPKSLLTLDRICDGTDIHSKKRLLEKLAELLANGYPQLDARDIFNNLFERERLGSTGLGHGVALPHARIDGIVRPMGAFVRVAGVPFDAIDNQPVVMALALIVPAQAHDTHLHLLAELAKLFGNTAIRESLREAPNAETLLDIFHPSAPGTC